MEEFSCTAEWQPHELEILAKEIPPQETHLTEPRLAWVEQASSDSTKFQEALSSASAACPRALGGPREIAVKIEDPEVFALREQFN